MGPLDHHELDLAVFKESRCESIARHLFDGRPVCQKILLRLHLGWELGLQRAALSRISICDLKGYRLRPLVDLLFGGPGKFPQTLFLYEDVL